MRNKISLKRRKGAAIELALIMLLVVFALCMIIVAVSMSFKSGVNGDYTLFDKKYQYGKVADEFAIHVENSSSINEVMTFEEKYCVDITYDTSTQEYTAVLFEDLNNKNGTQTTDTAVLTVKVLKGSSNTRITYWKYN